MAAGFATLNIQIPNDSRQERQAVKTATEWLSTRYVMPEWWLAAWSTSQVGEADATQRMARAKLAPAMGLAELGSLAQLLNRLQVQALTTPWGEAWELALSDHAKEAATAARTKRFIHEKVLQWLPAVRVLVDRDQSPGWHSFGLCREVGWQHGGCDEHGDPRGPVIHLQPDEYGRELLFGLCEGYTDLWRQVQQRKPAHELLGSHGPLFVWRSLWLELAGVEQNLLLNMERGLQWHDRWVQLEGALSMPVAALFSDQADEGGDSQGLLKERLQRLNRLGKILRQHGYVGDVDPTRFLALTPADAVDLNLVWQLGRERLTESFDVYHHDVARMFKTGLDRRPSEDFCRLIMGPEAGARVRQVARTVIHALSDRESAENNVGREPWALQLGSGRLVAPEYLFLEFCLRFQSSGDLAPPAELGVTSLRLLTDCFDDDENPRAKFERFVDYCKDHPEIAGILSEVPGATWAAPVTWQESRYGAAIRHFSGTVVPTSPRATEPEKPAVDQAAPTDEQSINRQVTTTAGEQAPSATLSGALASQLRRVATEELGRMRRSDRDAYRDLQKSWLASLSSDERQVISRLRQTLSESMFDRHLKERLIKFMADHPGAWRAREKPLTFRAEAPAWQ